MPDNIQNIISLLKKTVQKWNEDKASRLAAFDAWIARWFLGGQLLAQTINFVVSFGVITLLFALIYKVIPDAIIQWRDVWIGAVVTAFLFTIGKWALGLYLGNAAPGSVYGAAGSILLFLAWIYYAAQILFIGAEFTQVYANRYGSEIVADANAIPLTEEKRVQPDMPHDETVAHRQGRTDEETV